MRDKPFYLSNADVAWVESTLAGMTVDQKIRHLFCMIAYDADEASLPEMSREVEPCGVKLLGRSAFRGVSPVDAFCGKWDARL